MRYWVFNIAGNAGEPDVGSGWIRAETLERAMALVFHESVNLYEVPDDSGS